MILIIVYNALGLSCMFFIGFKCGCLHQMKKDIKMFNRIIREERNKLKDNE